MVAWIDLRSGLTLILAGAGILAFVFGWGLGYQNRKAKQKAAEAAQAAAEAAAALAKAPPESIVAMKGAALPTPEQIEKWLEALPAEDRAVGAFIIGGFACFLLALVTMGVLTLNTAAPP